MCTSWRTPGTARRTLWSSGSRAARCGRCSPPSTRSRARRSSPSTGNGYGWRMSRGTSEHCSHSAGCSRCCTGARTSAPANPAIPIELLENSCHDRLVQRSSVTEQGTLSPKQLAAGGRGGPRAARPRGTLVRANTHGRRLRGVADQLAARAVDGIPRPRGLGGGVRRGVGSARRVRSAWRQHAGAGQQGGVRRRAGLRPALRARRAELRDGLGRGQRARLLAAAVGDDEIRPIAGRARRGRDRRRRGLVTQRPDGAQTIGEILTAARARLARLTPAEAFEEFCAGATLVDIRPAGQRAAAGEVPGSVVVERNHLEWRFDPESDARLPWVTGYDLRPIVICEAGYTSSLAAVALQELGLDATDVIGGYAAWAAVGLPTARPEECAAVVGPGASPAVVRTPEFARTSGCDS